MKSTSLFLSFALLFSLSSQAPAEERKNTADNKGKTLPPAGITTDGPSNRTETEATVGGRDIMKDASKAILEKGVLYREGDVSVEFGDAGLNKEVFTPHDDDADFTRTLMNLSAGTQYSYKAYAADEDVSDNANFRLGGRKTFWTLAAEPATHPTSAALMATAASPNQINLDFPIPFNIGAEGYLVFRSAAANNFNALNLMDGIAPGAQSLPGNVEYLGSTINTDVSFSDNTAQPGTTYHYQLIPFNRVTDDATYNYKTDGTPARASATTPLSVSFNNQLTSGICKVNVPTTLKPIRINEGSMDNFRFVSGSGGFLLFSIVLPNGFAFVENTGSISAGSSTDVLFRDDGGRTGLFHSISFSDVRAGIRNNRRYVHVIIQNRDPFPSANIDELVITGLEVMATQSSLDPNTEYAITIDKGGDNPLPGVVRNDGTSPTVVGRLAVTNPPTQPVLTRDPSSGPYCTNNAIVLGVQSPEAGIDYTFRYGSGAPIPADTDSDPQTHTFFPTDASRNYEVRATSSTTGCFSISPEVKIQVVEEPDPANIVVRVNGTEYVPPDPVLIPNVAGNVSLVSVNASGAFSFAENPAAIVQDAGGNYFFSTTAVANSTGRYDVLFTTRCGNVFVVPISLFQANGANQIVGLVNGAICRTADPREIEWAADGIGGLDLTRFRSDIARDVIDEVDGKFYIVPANIPPGLGSIEINVDFTTTSGSNETIPQQVTVLNPPNLIINLINGDPLESSYCVGADPIELLGSPTVGVSRTFSVENLETGTTRTLTDSNELFFTEAPTGTPTDRLANYLPPNNGMGYRILFKFESAEGCLESETSPILQVLPLPEPLVPDLSRIFGFCIGEGEGGILPPLVIDDYDPTRFDLFWYNQDLAILDTVRMVGEGFQTNITNGFASENTYFVSKVSKTAPFCESPRTEVTVIISPRPIPDFEFSSSCGEPVRFVNTSRKGGSGINDDILRWGWDFGTAQTIIDAPDAPDTRHAFAAPGLYEVSLAVSNRTGCTDTLRRKVRVFSQMSVPELGLREDFESSDGGWTLDATATDLFHAGEDLSSWRWGEVNGDIIKSAGKLAWATNANMGTYLSDEDSWIESPCFSLTDVIRPMVNLETWYNSEIDLDGAVLQYTLNDPRVTRNNEEWINLGRVDEGLNWFNSSAITSTPGGQFKGWAGLSSEEDWQVSKFRLDDIKAAVGDTLVRFRIAFASNDGNPLESRFDGFAMDGFSIIPKDRIVLLEHFTKTDAPRTDTERVFLKNFIEANEGEVIDIHYHVASPRFDASGNKLPDDPFNLYNPFGPSARALHNGVGEIPRTAMDGILGIARENVPFSTGLESIPDFNTRVLEEAPFTLDIQQELAMSQGIQRLRVEVDVQKKVLDEDIEQDVMLMIAIVQTEAEFEGETYRNVFRDFLPNATGNRITGLWPAGEAGSGGRAPVVQFWNPKTPEIAASDLMIVAFLYNEDRFNATKEVYQVAYAPIPVKPIVASVVGLPEEFEASEFSIYPNPSQGHFTLLFPKAITQAHSVTVYGPDGRLLQEKQVPLGSAQVDFALAQWSSGLYYVRLQDEKGLSTIKKVILRR